MIQLRWRRFAWENLQMKSWKCLIVFSALTGCVVANGADVESWSRFRGSDGKGISNDASVPTKWDAGSLTWKTPIKGRGQSSPVVWGDRIFLTSAVDEGRQRLVLCIDTRSGKVLWEQVAWEGEPEKSHKMNGWATAT